jgi:hypothetical protein
MPRKRVNLRELLPPTWVPVHTTTPGRNSITKWMIYDGADNYRGDLTRQHTSWRDNWPGERPQDLWSWDPYSEGRYVINGTLDQCMEAIFQLAESS